MAPQLHFLGKRLFLEHMLTDHRYEEHQGFLRSLLINKRFLNIANDHRIYNVGIWPYSEEEIYLSFKSYPRRSSCHCGASTFEFIYCVLKLLKPSFTKFEYNSMSAEGGFSADSLLTLMQLASANGKVSFFINKCGGEDLSNVLKHVYEYADELICFPDLLPRADEVKFKLLDKFKVFCIKSNDELNAVLKHPTKRLDLHFYGEFEHDESVQLHKNDAKQCKLKFRRFEDVDQSYPIIQNVLNACEKLEMLDLNHESQLYDDVTDFATFLNGISQHYQTFTTLIKMIRQFYSNPKLNITFNFCQLWREIKTELPQDWQQQIRQLGGFQNAKIKEILKEEDNRLEKIIKISSKLIDAHSANAKFCFEILKIIYD